MVRYAWEYDEIESVDKYRICVDKLLVIRCGVWIRWIGMIVMDKFKCMS